MRIATIRKMAKSGIVIPWIVLLPTFLLYWASLSAVVMAGLNAVVDSDFLYLERRSLVEIV